MISEGPEQEGSTCTQQREQTESEGPVSGRYQWTHTVWTSCRDAQWSVEICAINPLNGTITGVLGRAHTRHCRSSLAGGGRRKARDPRSQVVDRTRFIALSVDPPVNP